MALVVFNHLRSVIVLDLDLVIFVAGPIDNSLRLQVILRSISDIIWVINMAAVEILIFTEVVVIIAKKMTILLSVEFSGRNIQKLMLVGRRSSCCHTNLFILRLDLEYLAYDLGFTAFQTLVNLLLGDYLLFEFFVLALQLLDLLECLFLSCYQLELLIMVLYLI